MRSGPHSIDGETLRERMDRLSMPEPNTGCTLFMGSQQKEGYGRVCFNGKVHLAHRVSYEMHVGPIPDGLVLDHLCRVPGCVNPRHLEPVTNRENVFRGVGPTPKNAAKTHCPRGHEYNDANTFRRQNGHRACRACAREKDAQRRVRERDVRRAKAKEYYMENKERCAAVNKTWKEANKEKLKIYFHERYVRMKSAGTMNLK